MDLPRIFPDGASGKDPICQCRRHRDMSSIPASGRSSGRGQGNPLYLLFPGQSHGQRSLVSYSPLSIESQRIRHDWSDLVCTHKHTHRYLQLRNLALFYVWGVARVWAHQNSCFDMHLSYLGCISSVSTLWIISVYTTGNSWVTNDYVPASFVYWLGS